METTSFQYSVAQEAWLQDLESGQHKQCRSALYNGVGWCCLGRACEILKIQKGIAISAVEAGYVFNGYKATGSMPGESWKLLGLRDSTGTFLTSMLKEIPRKKGPTLREPMPLTSLAELNDAGWTFKEIAEFIRKWPNAVFEGG